MAGAARSSESPSRSQGTRQGKACASVRHLVVRFTNDLSLLSVETSRPGRARYLLYGPLGCADSAVVDRVRKMVAGVVDGGVPCPRAGHSSDWAGYFSDFALAWGAVSVSASS